MTPASFPEANATFGPPDGVAESQCGQVKAYVGPVESGSMDGARIVVVAWQPSVEERATIAAGGPVFLTCLGGLPPHFLSTTFEQARRPS